MLIYKTLQVIVYILYIDKDVFVKVAGGLTVKEPAIDLAIAMAIVSSYQNKPMPIKTAVIGEVGLLGERCG